MQRKRCILGFIFLAVSSTACYASGDFGCDPPRGNLFFRTYQNCNSVPFLSPSNDSRLNLELLLIDAGKLTGTLDAALPQYYKPPPDFNSLRVPFDFDNWEPSPPGAAKNAGDANATADSNDYAQGESSRCNTASNGMGAFRDAVNAATGLPKDEAAILIAARGDLKAVCDATTHPDWKAPEGIHSAVGRDFVTYIAGANAFYAGDFAGAEKDFTSLKTSANPWLKETALYMVARTFLNSAPRDAFDEWGHLNLDKVDKGDLKGAEDAFNSYLHDYPQGIYAVSARGLLRRVYWLGNDRAQLAAAFDRAFANSQQGSSNVTLLELVLEADAKLLDSVAIDQIQSPQFLAILDLMNMRSGDQAAPGATSRSSFTLAQLESQKNRFAKNPALYNYLLAVFHVYIDDKPDQALALLPNLPSAPLNYFAFSQQTLRVLAMDQSKQFDAERAQLLAMLPLAKMPLQNEQLQMALARLEVHRGHVDRIFAPASPISDAAIRTIVVEYIASAEILRQRIKDAKENANVAAAAIYSLLYKELTGGKYQAFQSDLALVPPHPSDDLAPFVASKSTGYQCPALREVAATLQRDANDAQSLNCIGELVRLHDVHYGQDNEPVAGDLGGSDSMFPITNYSRLDSYIKVIAETQAAADARAYALYRAVNCFGPSGYNGCGKQNIPANTRKQWFEMLHKEYAASTWAKASKYYW
ncbi:MAG TPA: hypothetical protein VJX73_08855 [Terracidiphilus sp.]|nr:hypothetical protein [Terracidiphilus sp.]